MQRIKSKEIVKASIIRLILNFIIFYAELTEEFYIN